MLKRVIVSVIAWIGWGCSWSGVSLLFSSNSVGLVWFFMACGALIALIGVIAFRKITFTAVAIMLLSLMGMSLFALPLYFINILWFGGRLTKYSKWIWACVVVLLGSGAVNLIFSLNVTYHYIDLPSIIIMIFAVLGLTAISIMTLGIIGLRAWLVLQHLKREEKTSLLTYQSTLERIDHKMAQITQKLASLDVKY